MKIGTDDDETKGDAKPTTTTDKATESNKKATGETIKVAGESGAGKSDAGADTSGITGTFIVCVDFSILPNTKSVFNLKYSLNNISIISLSNLIVMLYTFYLTSYQSRYTN